MGSPILESVLRGPNYLNFASGTAPAVCSVGHDSLCRGPRDAGRDQDSDVIVTVGRAAIFQGPENPRKPAGSRR